MNILNILFLFVYLIVIALASQDENDEDTTTIIKTTIHSTATKTVSIVLNEFSTSKTTSSEFTTIITVGLSIPPYEPDNNIVIPEVIPSHKIIPTNPYDSTPTKSIMQDIPSYSTVSSTVIPTPKLVPSTVPSYKAIYSSVTKSLPPSTKTLSYTSLKSLPFSKTIPSKVISNYSTLPPKNSPSKTISIYNNPTYIPMDSNFNNEHQFFPNNDSNNNNNNYNNNNYNNNAFPNFGSNNNFPSKVPYFKPNGNNSNFPQFPYKTAPVIPSFPLPTKTTTTPLPTLVQTRNNEGNKTGPFIGFIAAIGGGALLGAAGVGIFFIRKKNPKVFKDIGRRLSQGASSIKRKMTGEGQSNNDNYYNNNNYNNNNNYDNNNNTFYYW